MKIRDVTLEPEFVNDWNYVKKYYPEIADRVDNKVYMALEIGSLPPSLQEHKAWFTGGTISIGYITVGRQGWRLLFNVDAEGVMHLHRLVTHDQEKTAIASYLTG